jgi:predicted esterase
MRPIALFALVSCAQPFAPRSDAPSPAPLTAASAALVPLGAEWLQTLRDEQGRVLGVVAVPLGARTPRRIVVGVHAAAGRADRRRIDDSFAALLREHGAYLDTSRVTYFGHSQGAMILPYAFTPHVRSKMQTWSTVVFFEGLPREPERVTPAMRAMGAEHVVLISGQPGWAAGHRALAAQLNRGGIRATHLAHAFGHSARPEVLRDVLGSLPNEW